MKHRMIAGFSVLVALAVSGTAASAAQAAFPTYVKGGKALALAEPAQKSSSFEFFVAVEITKAKDYFRVLCTKSAKEEDKIGASGNSELKIKFEGCTEATPKAVGEKCIVEAAGKVGVIEIKLNGTLVYAEENKGEEIKEILSPAGGWEPAAGRTWNVGTIEIEPELYLDKGKIKKTKCKPEGDYNILGSSIVTLPLGYNGCGPTGCTKTEAVVAGKEYEALLLQFPGKTALGTFENPATAKKEKAGRMEVSKNAGGKKNEFAAYLRGAIAVALGAPPPVYPLESFGIE